MPKTVLIVDDDAEERRRLETLVARCGYATVSAASAAEALLRLDSAASDGVVAVILDLVMPDLDGMGVLARLRGRIGVPPVIVHASSGGIDTVPSALRAGACDFIVRPAGLERLAAALGNAVRLGVLERALLDRSPASVGGGLEGLVTASPAMMRARDLGLRAARSGLPLLVTGETGTGKRMFSRAVNAASDRADRNAVWFSARAETPADLRAAFAKARDSNSALMVGDVDALCEEGQGLLARWFDGSHFGFSGAASAARRQVRFYATTRVDLAACVRSGSFRDDLYMRLAVQPVPLPSLRDRPQDIEALADEIAIRAGLECGRAVRGIDRAALDLIRAYAWPGNLRELDLVLHRAVLMSDGDMIGAAHLPTITGEVAPLRRRAAKAPSGPAAAGLPPPSGYLDAAGRPKTLAAIEAEAIRQALDRASGHVGRAAADLGIGRSTLYRKARDLGLVADQQDALLGDAA